MSEQLYYTWSSIGSGPSSGERIRAWSSGVGSVNSAPVQALRPYLLYKLPSGTSHTTPDEAPISLTYAKTGHHTLLVQRVYAGKDGVGRPGNLFSHAILNPEKISPVNQIEPLSAQDAIRLWRAPVPNFWLTDESQIPTRSTTIDSLAPEHITNNIRTDLFFPRDQFTIDPTTVFGWLSTVFSAFLMLKRLGKKQLYLAAPADMVAAIIWCITRCLPRSLTIMQELTFSTYEHDITKSPVTIVGTCWLPPANHQGGSFIPSYDLPASCYQGQESNPILAINCYNSSKKTLFTSDEQGQVQKFVDFATQSLRNNDTKRLDTLIEQAERKDIQDFDTFLVPFRLLNEVPTESTVKQVLTTQALWFCLQFQNIREKLLELFHTEHYFWQSSQAEGKKALQEIHQYAKLNPQSEEAQALKDIAMALLNELIFALTNQQTNDVLFWDLTLKDCSSLESAPDLWITLPKRFAGLAYNAAYQSWWDESGKLIVDYLVSSATTGSRLTGKQRQDLQENMKLWWNQSAEYLKGAWNQVEPRKFDSAFWINQLLVLHAPQCGDNRWHTLFEELDRIRPQRKALVQICNWETYMTLMRIWLYIGYDPSDSWLTIPWQYMPNLQAIPDSEFPDKWKYTALRVKILSFPSRTNINIPQMLDNVARSAPHVHHVLAQLIQDDQRRQYAVTFCQFLLQYKYSLQDELLATILPYLFPYEQYKRSIVNAAQLSPEQLNSYTERIIYNHLTTSQETPNWFFSALCDYFTNFRPTTINPDRQTDRKQSQPVSTILDTLIKYNQQLPEDVYHHISLWYNVNKLFQQQQSHFSAYVLKDINNRINQIKLPEAVYTELRQELFSFLVNHTKTEADLVRVIDHLQDALMLEQSVYPYKIMDMHKEITHLVGESTPKQGANIAKTIICIKGLLNDAISLRNLNIGPIDQFVNECLNNLLSPLNDKQIRDIQSTQNQWNTDISKEWERYLNVYKAQRQSAKSSLLSRAQLQLSSMGGGRHHAQSDPPPNQQQNRDQQPFNQSQQGQGKLVLSAHDPAQYNSSAQPTNNPIPRNLVGKAAKLQQALNNQQVDVIAQAYDEQLDPGLNPEDKKRARIAQEIMRTYNEGKNANDFHDFVTFYDDYRKDFRWSKEIESTLDNFKLEALQISLTSGKIEEIAKHYKDRFYHYLSLEDKQLAHAAIEIFNAYNESKNKKDYYTFINAYRKHFKDFIATDRLILSNDIEAAIARLGKKW